MGYVIHSYSLQVFIMCPLCATTVLALGCCSKEKHIPVLIEFTF